MSLWGPAVEAEIEYRQAELTKAWGSRRSRDAERGRGADRRKGRRAENRTERPDRTEQIRAGLAGMRPASGTRGGLFA